MYCNAPWVRMASPKTRSSWVVKTEMGPTRKKNPIHLMLLAPLMLWLNLMNQLAAIALWHPHKVVKPHSSHYPNSTQNLYTTMTPCSWWCFIFIAPIVLKPYLLYVYLPIVRCWRYLSIQFCRPYNHSSMPVSTHARLQQVYAMHPTRAGPAGACRANIIAQHNCAMAQFAMAQCSYPP